MAELRSLHEKETQRQPTMTNRMDFTARETAVFGPFRLDASERLLTKDNEPIAIGGRALDILIALVERAGKVVSRKELIERVWPNLFVEEANLRVHIAALRKALGDGQAGCRYIVNVPGRGYSFVAPVNCRINSGAPLTVNHPVQKLPTRLARMIGREDTISTLTSLLKTRRFVSIVGPGGIGKTTVAVAVAEAMLDDFCDGVCFIDLSALTHGSLVARAAASATGCFVQPNDPVTSLLAFLAGKKVLLVLDNCEHVIESVAALSERLVQNAPQVHLLTTSREALRVEGENVHLLLALDIPDADGELTAAKALTYSAVQLFMERAAAAGNRRELQDDEAPLVADICRRLDGIPLAIELVAGRAGSYGIRGTLSLLDKQINLLWQGGRNASPRQQTLQAMLDWSYNLLSEYEQKILRRLSIFGEVFTLDAAQRVAGDPGDDATKVANAVASLVDKSLIWVSDKRKRTLHRLLYTTRSYAGAKLAESTEWNAVARRHAQYFSDRLKLPDSGADSSDMPASAQIMNVRAALDWSFSSSGDVTIGVELAERAAPSFLQLSLLDECEQWCTRALAALPQSYRETKSELILLEALAISSMFSHGNSDEVRSAIERGLHLADRLEDLHHQMQLLAGLNLFLIRTGDFRTALIVANRSMAVAEKGGDISAVIMVEWMLGVANHLVGDQAAAQRHCERGFELADQAEYVYVDFFGYDHHVRALVAMARALWLRGYASRALRFARQAIEEATNRNHPIAVSISYIYSIPVFLWVGDLDEAAKHVETLIAHTARYSLEPYHAVALALKGELMVASGQAVGGVELLRNAMAYFNAGRHHVLTAVFNRALAEGLALCGRFDDAANIIDTTIARAAQFGENFDFPDLLRARGEILSAGPQANLAAAEKAFVQSLDRARKQSALGWELPAALPLARIWIRQGHIERARALLADICARFVDGDCCKDLRTAARLLATCDTHH
jgi:predicted ATPase/DNA-binding winged helix-turn-helix (wHTH) protein